MSLFVGISTTFMDSWENPVAQSLSFAPVQEVGKHYEWNGLEKIKQGQVWRVVTPIFLHMGILHLAFNMIWLYQLGSQIESLRGPWRFALLVLAIAICSNVLQYYYPFKLVPFGFSTRSAVFGGMSGVVYGLFGYIWMKRRYQPELGLYVDETTVIILIAWLLICMVGYIPLLGSISIANTAHLIGLLVGMGWATAPLLWKRR